MSADHQWEDFVFSHIGVIPIQLTGQWQPFLSAKHVRSSGLRGRPLVVGSDYRVVPTSANWKGIAVYSGAGNRVNTAALLLTDVIIFRASTSEPEGHGEER